MAVEPYESPAKTSMPRESDDICAGVPEVKILTEQTVAEGPTQTEMVPRTPAFVVHRVLVSPSTQRAGPYPG